MQEHGQPQRQQNRKNNNCKDSKSKVSMRRLTDTAHNYRTTIQTKTNILHTLVAQDSCQKVRVLFQIPLFLLSLAFNFETNMQ